MDADALRIFVKVAELGSFTRAAEQLGMPKARASARVAALEAELGVRLLQRTTRVVRTTADGEQLLPRARQLVAAAEDIASMFAGGQLRGRVRIDLPHQLAYDAVIPRLPELLAAHPQLELFISTSDRRVEVVREGFDCVLSVGQLPASGLVAQRLGHVSMVNCASPAYLRRHGTPRSLADLDRHLIVNYGAGPPVFEYRDGDGYAEHPMRAAVTVNSTGAYRAACLAGTGIIQVPRIGVRAQLEDGALVEVLAELASAPMPVSLVHPHGRSVPRRVRVVMQWIAAAVAPRLG